MSTNWGTEPDNTCLCPLIDISGREPRFVRGDPRGTGCPLHETQGMRDQREQAKWQARYGDREAR